MLPSLTNNAYSFTECEDFSRHKRYLYVFSRQTCKDCVVFSLTINQEINHLLSESFLIRNPVEKREREKEINKRFWILLSDPISNL